MNVTSILNHARMSSSKRLLRRGKNAMFAMGKWHLDSNPVERSFDCYFDEASKPKRRKR